jgi:rhodanese-related sulfurtransferase
MMTRLQEPLREAAAIFLASVVLGFGYTALSEQGFFARKATQSAAATNEQYAPSFISYEEALQYYTGGNAVFVDARHEFDYKLGHIKGSINIPLKELDEKMSLLASQPKDAILITYCDGAECNSSLELGTKLAAAGYSNVKIFFGGWNEWQSHHQVIEQ